ncbi:MAG: GAF domain-containing protein [Bacteroidales bacterium]|nr:GAF domain-containing protein [Bacteroidales bacterium]
MVKQIDGIKYFSLLILMWHFFYATSIAQESGTVKFENISLKDGLSQSSVNCIMQDSKGLMWFGTEDGLNKYDGYTFTIYKPSIKDSFSISDQRIISIYEDNDRYIWIGTANGGLNRFDRNLEQFVHFLPQENNPNSISGAQINAILKASDGLLWIGTNNGINIYSRENSSFSRPATNSRISEWINEKRITCLMEDHEQNIWIGSTDGLLKLNVHKNSFEIFRNDPVNPASLSNNTITSIFLDNTNRIWVGTEKGLNMYLGAGVFKIFVHENNTSSLIFDHVSGIIQDDRNNIWIGTRGGGLSIYNPVENLFSSYQYETNNPYSISYNEILSIHKDYSGIIWLATNGLDKYNPHKEKFSLYDYIPYTKENNVYRNIHSIYEDRYGVLWIASKGDGIHLLDRQHKRSGRISSIPGNANSLPSDKVRVIKEFENGIVWIGTDDNGLTKITLNSERQPVSYKHYKLGGVGSNYITSNRIYSIYKGKNGSLWIGTDNGLNKLDPESDIIKQYLPDEFNENSLNDLVAYSIYGDSEGTIWIATDNGINYYDPEIDGFFHYLKDDGDTNTLSNNEILCFTEDNEGNIWIGTYGGGLNKFDKKTKKFLRFSSIKELATAVIYGIIEDRNKNLWLSTNNGIIEFNPETGYLKQFSIEDGLQSNEYNGGSFYKSASGEIFFGGQYGFNSFYPEKISLDQMPPKLILTELKIKNVPVLPGENSPIKKHISEVKSITLSHDQNNFTIYFAALHYANPQHNLYKYKLEGFDDDWINVGMQRFVSYTSLPYKTYTFKVIAANSDGIWNMEGIDLTIKVSSPFWRRWWFVAFILLSIILITVYLIRERRKRIITEKRILKEKLQKGNEELEKQKQEIAIQQQELKLRQKEEKDVRWYNEGLNELAEVMSDNKGDILKLSSNILSSIIQYIDASTGGIFLINDDDENNQYLELVANYGYSIEEQNNRFSIGEGLVGMCFKEQKIVEIDKLSNNYFKISSGLGSEKPKHMVLVPLKHDTTVLGVMELASFQKLTGYKILLLEKISENITSNLFTERANKKLKEILEKLNKQTEEMASKEEELRQNLEEMQATQEEATRREDELIIIAEEAASKEEELNAVIYELTNKITSLEEKLKKSTEIGKSKTREKSI